MKLVLRTAIVITLVAVILPWQAVLAQDFNALLDAIERIEVKLSKMVQQEAATRNEQFAELSSTLAGLDGSGSGQAVVTEEQLADVMVELVALRVEVQGLRRSLDNNARQLASIDPEAWVSPGPSDDRVDQLASKLATLNQNIEVLAAKQSKPAQKPATRRTGPKTTVNGRLYSHGMVDYGDGNDDQSEFGVTRAYVTLKSKLSSFASIRLTTDFKSIDNKYNIILKYAYLDWQPGFSHGYAKLRLGLQATQYIDQMNKLWGRRYLKKTVSDSRKFLTSSDFGVSTIVGFGPKSKYGFASLAVLNGTSYSSVEEVNTSKDFNLVSLIKPFKNVPSFKKSALIVQLYTGTQNEVLDDIVTVDTTAAPWDSTVTTVGASDWKRQMVSIGGLLAWNSTLDFGFDMNFTTVGEGAGEDNIKKRGLSFFGSFYLKKLAAGSSFASSLNFFGRVDTYDPNTGTGDDGQTLGIFGIESVPVKGFKVALNYRSASYDDDAHDSNSSFYVNTLFKF